MSPLTSLKIGPRSAQLPGEVDASSLLPVLELATLPKPRAFPHCSKKTVIAQPGERK